MWVLRQRWLWETSINPIDENTWNDIQAMLEQAEGELMSSFSIGMVVSSFVDLDAEYSLLRCNNQIVLASEYPVLASLVPSWWISGLNMTIPNMSYHSIHGGYSNPSSNVGDNNHQLTIAEMPIHTHAQNAHVHSEVSAISTPTAGGELPGTASLVTTPIINTGATIATNQNTGADSPHNNIPKSRQVIWYVVAR